jgi:hypothetical protein
MEQKQSNSEILANSTRTYTAFAGHHFLTSGSIKPTLGWAKEHFDKGDGSTLLIFDDTTGKQVDFDFEGTPEQVQEKLAWHPLFRSAETLMTSKAGPGRPKLGVVSREISLLPRHWEWLEQQPQGASAAIRRLVDEARKRHPGEIEARKAREAAGSFMWAMAGNLPGFEEASRALYKGDREGFDMLIREWPADVQRYLGRLLEGNMKDTAA